MMTGLEQVKTALTEALEQAGCKARAAFPSDWAAKYDESVVVVGVRTGESCEASLGSYLGQKQDETTGQIAELYGAQMTLQLSMDTYSPATLGAAGCDDTLEMIHHVLLRGLPSGLKPTEFKWEETVWNEDTAMFLRKGSLVCKAYFIAQADEDGAVIRDFILKGVMTK